MLETGTSGQGRNTAASSKDEAVSAGLAVIPANAGQKSPGAIFEPAEGWPEGRDTEMYPVIQNVYVIAPKGRDSMQGLDARLRGHDGEADNNRPSAQVAS